MNLAHAQTALAIAQRGVEAADLAIRDADHHLREAMRSPTSQTRLDWYRSWRVRCGEERDVCDQRRRACEAALREATIAVSTTQQRVRSLELLHDNALAAWRRVAAHEEQTTMDALATSRFTRRKDGV